MERETLNQLARLNFLHNRIFGRNIDMSSFERRMQLQKAVYILQSEGIDLGYNFTWYLRGPYSSQLADDGYAYVRNRDQDMDLYAPTSNERRVIDKLERAGDLIQDPTNAELIASYLYLERRYDEDASEELKTRKPRFTLHQISEIVQRWRSSD